VATSVDTSPSLELAVYHHPLFIEALSTEHQTVVAAAAELARLTTPERVADVRPAARHPRRWWWTSSTRRLTARVGTRNAV
jgi:hypothetical protein